LSATVVGGLAAEYFFRLPYFAFPNAADEIVPLGLYLIIGGGTSVLGHRLARARQEAQTRALELDTLMRVSPIGVAIASDPECHRISVNPAMAAMLRIRVSDNGSMTAPAEERPSFKVLKDGVPVPASELPLQRAARLGIEVRDVELDVEHPDGTRVSLYEYANPLFDAQGAPRGAIGAFLDITERRRNEEALKQAMADNAELYRQAQEANQLKDQFLATLSHELRTPLNALQGWLQLLRSGQLSEAKRTRALDAIERSAELQARLTADLLDGSAAMTGKLRLNREQVDVAPLLEGVVESMRAAAEEKGLHLHGAIGRTGVMDLDPSRIQQIVGNLVSNAIKFTPPGGRVDVMVSEVAGELCLVVADTGIGIPPDFLPFVFDRFRQADAGPTREHSGLGLGLAIVRHLVELHEGTVEVSSVERQGTTFTVRLPAAPMRAALPSYDSPLV
jgi:signal transduction histidine kinase